ncbi:putative transposase fragment [Cupriavidus phytorum]|uniref:Transposase n=3 Tax=Cupriavidus TaxID=106589 RepID=A0A375DCK4_9BURK|nr:transposase [Cupriavidus taiwanensis]CAP64101.1 putative transposase fragment [Cupriavidus taiwanensis LMG 19424]SOZ40547.1 putative transposase fragment [Cupriavidus neocaledonicus]SOY76001.1 putative transposase fragment [Cupriavidus taiwanensis]SOY77851.1 putative transposase fragment [Cupriavidus taiwanensis]
MRKPETITTTMRELDRLKVIQAVVDHGLAVWRAAEKLGLSRRQVERLVLRYREDGPSGLGSRKRGRDSNRQLPSGLESRVRGLIRGSYADFGPTLAAEKLRERHGIDLATETVRRIMIDAGFWVPLKCLDDQVKRNCRSSLRKTTTLCACLPSRALEPLPTACWPLNWGMQRILAPGVTLPHR